MCERVYGCAWQVYPDPVRVVSVGVAVEELLADPSKASHADSSTEFCGGTHVATTGEAQSFVLLQEEGIAKGIRRITGATAHHSHALLFRLARMVVYMMKRWLCRARYAGCQASDQAAALGPPPCILGAEHTSAGETERRAVVSQASRAALLPPQPPRRMRLRRRLPRPRGRAGRSWRRR